MGKLVFVVDQESAYHDIYKAFLDDYKIIGFKSIEDACQHLEKEKPSLILSALNFDGRTGIEFLKLVRLNKVLADLPFIICTQDFSEENLEESFKSGATDFLNKDFLSGIVLKTRVDRVIDSYEKSKIIEDLLEERTGFIRLLCHDIANPLHIAFSYNKKIKKLTTDPLIEKCVLKTQKALNQVNDIIEYTRTNLSIKEKKREVLLEPIPIRKIIDEITFLTEEKVRNKEITLLVDFNEDNFEVMAEKKTITTNALINIFTNAIKFTPRGGQIKFEVIKEGDIAKLTIEDNGIGIPAELKNKLFETNAHTSRKGTDGEAGTGYGLPLVKTFIESYGGKIELESQDIENYPHDHWTRFQIELKVA